MMRGPVDFRFFRKDHILFTLAVVTFLIYWTVYLPNQFCHRWGEVLLLV